MSFANPQSVEGYMAAKDEVLERLPTARCRRITYGSDVLGYVVYPNREAEREGPHKRISHGSTAREAWNSALAWCEENNPAADIRRALDNQTV